ncbi:MAG TPA: recombinase family protein [Sphingomicrobium sp.]|nr:recombinase family protein [Sphingomicrobium sp.]
MAINSLVSPRLQRCAIYTRKSTQQGLEREFNSLEGQRAICSAYVTSQRHKGWAELAKHYDDAGISGATLERAALQELLGDVERGLVDVVLVYKLDRITRTLLDFVRLVDFFEKYGITFVSITQNFDTADSMGRLVLNVLLTFAQFEREIAADRIRDKFAIMKQSGRWSGGPAPMGYDLIRRRLHVNEAEAETIRQIFSRFLQLGTYEAVYRECRDQNVRSKRWRTRAGRTVGGGPITKAFVYHVLGNPIYIGEIRHRDVTYPGLHAPIVDRDLWSQAQALRTKRAARSRAGVGNYSLLTDLLHDSSGRTMSVKAYTSRYGKLYRYYASNQSGWGKRQRLKRLRCSADQLEEIVIAALRDLLANREQVRAILLGLGRCGKDVDEPAALGAAAAHRLSPGPRDRLRLMLNALVMRIEVSLERVKIVVRCSELERFLHWDGVGLFRGQKTDWGRIRNSHLLDVPAGTARYHRKLLMPLEPRRDGKGLKPVPGLQRLIREARETQMLADRERDKSLGELAAMMNVKADRFARLLRLNYLAPDIVAAIIDGAQPPGLTRRALIGANLPMDWALQRRLLGFPARATPEGY